MQDINLTKEFCYGGNMQKTILYMIHIYSGITSGRVLNGELLYDIRTFA